VAIASSPAIGGRRPSDETSPGFNRMLSRRVSASNRLSCFSPNCTKLQQELQLETMVVGDLALQGQIFAEIDGHGDTQLL